MIKDHTKKEVMIKSHLLGIRSLFLDLYANIRKSFVFFYLKVAHPNTKLGNLSR